MESRHIGLGRDESTKRINTVETRPNYLSLATEPFSGTRHPSFRCLTSCGFQHSGRCLLRKGVADTRFEVVMTVNAVSSRLIELPSMPASSDDLLRTAAEYTRVHQDLERLVLPQLALVSSDIAEMIFEQMGVSAPTIYESAHDLFRPLISLSTLGAMRLRAWIAVLATGGTRGDALVIEIQHSMMPKALIALRVGPTHYRGYYCDAEVIHAWVLSDQADVDTTPPVAPSQPAATEPSHRVTTKAEQAVSWTFELLEGIKNPEPPGEAVKCYESTLQPWRSAGLYSGTESEVRAILIAILSEWEKRPDFDKFTVRMHPQVQFVEAFSYTTSYRPGDRADEGDSFMPAMVWRTSEGYFAFGSHMFKARSIP